MDRRQFLAASASSLVLACLSRSGHAAAPQAFDITDAVWRTIDEFSWTQARSLVRQTPPSWAALSPGWSPPSAPDFKAWASTLDHEIRWIMVDGAGLPELAAVLVPRSLAQGEAPPVILYIHPSLGQNAAAYAGQEYPLGPSYLSIGLRYLATDGAGSLVPLTSDGLSGVQWFSPGLGYQLAAGGRRAIIVLPIGCCPGTKSLNGVVEFGSLFRKAGLLESFLGVVVGAATGAPTRTPGRLVLAAFSAGNDSLIQALAFNKGGNLYTNLLHEVWSFDPASSDRHLGVIANASAWRSARKTRPGASADNGDRIFRIFSSQSGGTILDGGTWAAGGGDWTTLYSCPGGCWQKNPGTASAAAYTHGLFAATFMTHAVRMSALPR